MKAHDGWLESFQQVGEFAAERRASAAGGHRGGVNAEFGVVGRERGTPFGLAGRVGRGRRVAEEVDVVRPSSLRGDGFQFCAKSVKCQHGAGQ